jgi:hypothetical protein
MLLTRGADVRDIGETFRPQQILGYVHRRGTDAGNLGETDAHRFRRRLGIRRLRSDAGNPRGGACPEQAEEFTTGLVHGVPLRGRASSPLPRDPGEQVCATLGRLDRSVY